MTTILGHQGYLGRVVARRWHELGHQGDYVVVCLAPDNLELLRRLAGRPGVIVPSTDAIIENTRYAATKRELEAIGGLVVIRAGIIDTRKRNDNINAVCNPLTPLEWADLAWELRDQPGIHPAGRETVTRHEIGWALSDVFGGDMPAAWDGPHSDRRQSQDRDREPLFSALQDYDLWLA